MHAVRTFCLSYICEKFSSLQATKSALFEKWLTAGKDWSLILASYSVKYVVATLQWKMHGFLVSIDRIHFIYYCFLYLRLKVESTRSHTDRNISMKKMGASSWARWMNHSLLSRVSPRYLNIYVWVWGWRTRSQIIALHGGDERAADRIIANKESQGAVQYHVDDPELKTFYVMILDLGTCECHVFVIGTSVYYICPFHLSQQGMHRDWP